MNKADILFFSAIVLTLLMGGYAIKRVYDLEVQKLEIIQEECPHKVYGL